MRRPAALAPALLAAVLAACASTGPTTVPAPHVAKVARDVQQWHDVKHPDCPYAEVVATRVLGRDGARARELWTIAACGGRRFDYVVTVAPLDGATWDAVSDWDGR